MYFFLIIKNYKISAQMVLT